MAKRSNRSSRLISAVLLLVGVTSALVWSSVLVARSLKALAANVLAAAIAPLLEGLAAALYGMMLQEIAVALVVWSTRGPFWTLAWISLRATVWQGR